MRNLEIGIVRLPMRSGQGPRGHMGLEVKGRYSDNPWKIPRGSVVLRGSLRSLGLSKGQM